MTTSVQLWTLESQTHVGKTVINNVKAPLVEFHQRLKDTACSKQFIFCKKHDPSFSHLLIFHAFGAAFGVPISGFLPANVAGAARARARRDPSDSPQPGAIPLPGQAGNLYGTGTTVSKLL